MKKQKKTSRGFFAKFNLWLFLVCLMLAVIIWSAVMYTADPEGLRGAEEVAAAVAGRRALL